MKAGMEVGPPGPCFAACWASGSPPCPWHWHGGCKQVGDKTPLFASAGVFFLPDAAWGQPSLTSSFPICSPSGAGAVYPPGHKDEGVFWDTVLFGDTSASSSSLSLAMAGSGPTCVCAHGGGAVQPYKGAPCASPLWCACPIVQRNQQGGDQLWAGEAAPQVAHPLERGLSVSGSPPYL